MTYKVELTEDDLKEAILKHVKDKIGMQGSESTEVIVKLYTHDVQLNGQSNKRHCYSIFCVWRYRNGQLW